MDIRRVTKTQRTPAGKVETYFGRVVRTAVGAGLRRGQGNAVKPGMSTVLLTFISSDLAETDGSVAQSLHTLMRPGVKAFQLPRRRGAGRKSKGSKHEKKTLGLRLVKQVHVRNRPAFAFLPITVSTANDSLKGVSSESGSTSRPRNFFRLLTFSPVTNFRWRHSRKAPTGSCV